jgi:hypothetical protein
LYEYLAGVIIAVHNIHKYLGANALQEEEAEAAAV